MKNFYNLLMMGPNGLKKMCRATDSTKEKAYYWFLIVLRAILVVVVAVIAVTLCNLLFGEENSALATVFFVMVLILRSVNFSYRLSDSLVTLAVAVAFMVLMPALSVLLPDPFVFFVHFIGLLGILLITAQTPMMGFGGFFGFAYSYLVGNAVTGELLVKRAELAVVGYVVCAVVLIVKHRKADADVTFFSLLRKFSFKNPISLWQIRLAFGVSLMLAFGQIFDIPRFMWLAFACATVLAPYPCSGNTQVRFADRIEGIAIGSVSFFILCHLIPESFLSAVPLITGTLLGFCTTYRWKTIFICFGALTQAIDLFGVQTASLLRIVNNVTGAVFGMAFALFFDWLLFRRLVKEQPAAKSA